MLLKSLLSNYPAMVAKGLYGACYVILEGYVPG
jgi:hypothetical protein